MYAEERRQAMAGLITQRGRLSVNELADAFTVTTETVRRDLSALEQGGLVRRVHGGAVPAEALSFLETAVTDRDRAHAPEKDRIAQAAIELLPRSGGSVLLDAGTTTSRLATHLPMDRRLIVVTNAVPIATRLAGLAGVELHLLPGRVRTTTHAAVGDDTVAALARLRLDVAFVGTNGVSLDHGLSTPDHAEAAAKKAMVAAGRRVVVLADSTKIGAEHNVRFAELGDIDVLVTDDGISDGDHKAFEDYGIDVVIA